MAVWYNPEDGKILQSAGMFDTDDIGMRSKGFVPVAGSSYGNMMDYGTLKSRVTGKFELVEKMKDNEWHVVDPKEYQWYEDYLDESTKARLISRIVETPDDLRRALKDSCVIFDALSKLLETGRLPYGASESIKYLTPEQQDKIYALFLVQQKAKEQ